MAARMACDLVVEDDMIPAVLSLLEQIDALRRQMNALTGATQQQPGDMRTAILEELRWKSAE